MAEAHTQFKHGFGFDAREGGVLGGFDAAGHGGQHFGRFGGGGFGFGGAGHGGGAFSGGKGKKRGGRLQAGEGAALVVQARLQAVQIGGDSESQAREGGGGVKAPGFLAFARPALGNEQGHAARDLAGRAARGAGQLAVGRAAGGKAAKRVKHIQRAQRQRARGGGRGGHGCFFCGDNWP